MLKSVKRNKNASSTASKKTTTAKGKGNLSPEEIQALIQQKAYELYCRRDQNNGDPVTDWLKAEQKIRQELRVL